MSGAGGWTNRCCNRCRPSGGYDAPLPVLHRLRRVRGSRTRGGREVLPEVHWINVGPVGWGSKNEGTVSCARHSAMSIRGVGCRCPGKVPSQEIGHLTDVPAAIGPHADNEGRSGSRRPRHPTEMRSSHEASPDPRATSPHPPSAPGSADALGPQTAVLRSRFRWP